MRSGACSACGFQVASLRPRMSAESESEDIAHRRGPALDCQAVMLEQRQRDALDTEPDAGGVGGRARRGLDLPGAAEQVAVIVEADARRRMFLRVDRHQQFELQALLALAGGKQPSGTPEERVVRDVDFEGQAERADDRLPTLLPLLAKRQRLLLAAQPHMLALAEHLHACRIDRGLVAKAPSIAIDQRALFRQPAARGDRGIDAVAGRRRQRDLGRALARRPVAALRQRLQHRAMVGVVAGEAVHRADQLRRAVEIAALLELPFADARRKTHHMRAIGIADLADGGIDALDHALEQAAATVQAVDSHGDQQAGLQQLVAIGALEVRYRHSSRPGSSRSAMRRLPVLARMRSLLTIKAAEWASRKWRPRL